jgi:hypothetical protein
MTAESASRRISVQKTARKKYENKQTSVGDIILSSKQAYSMVNSTTVCSYSEHGIVFHFANFASLCLY